MTEPSSGGRPNATDAPESRSAMDAVVGYVLLVGVLVSLVLVVAALAWSWAETGTLSLDYELTGMNLLQLLIHELQAVAHGALRPRTLLSLGVVVLMLTPFVRVLASMVYFATVLRNWRYSVITAVVLAALVHSLFLR